MTTQIAPSVPTKRLAAAILSTDMSFTLNDILSWDQINNLVASDFSTAARGVFRSPDNKQIEFFTWDPTTVASASITILARGLDYKGGTTDGVKPKYNWPANSTLVELGSNPPATLEDYVDKVSNESIGGIKTFTDSPVVPTGGTGTQAANATDIANAVTGASGLATNLVNGTLKTSVAPAVPGSPIAVGDNDSRVPTANQTAALVGNNTDIAVGSGNKVVTQTGLIHNAEKYAADTSGSSTAYVVALSPVPTSLTVGMVIYAKIVNANTTTTPTLNPNGLGAKTIVKNASSALAVGDIAANMFCTFIYDGTNLVLQTPAVNLGNKIALVTTDVVLTADASNLETTLVSVTVPGGTLGTTNAFRIKALITACQTDNASAGNLVFKVKYGGTTVVSFSSVVPISGSVTTDIGFIEAVIFANASVSAQLADGLLLFNRVDTVANPITRFATGSAAIASGSDQTLLLTAQWANSTSATNTLTLSNAVIEKIS